VYFKTEFGADRSPTRKGLWWTVSAEDVEEELNQCNQWAIWAKKQRPPIEEESAPTEVSLAQVLALSYRRLQALHQVSGPEHPDYPVFLHLHEQIREARRVQALREQVLPIDAREPLPPLSPFIMTPVWKLMGEVQEQHDPVTQTTTVVYGNPEQARYGFTVIDPYHHPSQPSHPVRKKELYTFESQAQSLAVHYEYQVMEHVVGDVTDYQANVTIVEPWEPSA
jgi:hypothetical protein